MSTTSEVLQLHLAQAEQSLERAKNNSYSDYRKEVYHKKLSELFKKIKADLATALPALTDQQIYDGPKKHLDFIFKSLEFLDSSTLNQIPYEIVACLNHAMQEFLDPTDRYIIVTSLINNVEGFSYDSWIAFDTALYTDIYTKYGIEFEDKLVQINLPRTFARDYIAAVVLYHELGHFIDLRFSLMKKLTRTTLDRLTTRYFTAPQETELLTYFPYLIDLLTSNSRPNVPSNSSLYQVFLFHFMEYFCDLFGAQYVGEASNFYLSYITTNENNWATTHPATTNRTRMVSEYINGTNNLVVNLINEALTGTGKTTLRKRYTDVPPDDFFSLIPTDITTFAELHGLITVAWDLWLNHKTTLGNRLNTTDATKIYNVINNLVEKSIGNYITVNKWQTAFQHLNQPTAAAPVTSVAPTPSPIPTPAVTTPAQAP